MSGIPFFFKVEYHFTVCIHHVSLSIHPSMDSCTSNLLAVVQNATMNMGVQISLWDPALNYFEYISRSGIAGSYGNVTCNFSRALRTVAHIPVLHPRFPISPYPCQHLIPILWTVAILMGGRWDFNVLLGCTSLIIGNDEHLSMSLLTICIASWGKCLFKPLLFFSQVYL